MNKIETLLETANFLSGMAAMTDKFEVESKLKYASEQLKFLSRHICGGGFICSGGPNCDSDHK